jgi:RHS repeat-associated protein
VRGSPGATVRNAYYANDLIRSQEIAGVARQTWSLDALGRFSSYSNEAWAAGADGAPAWQEAVTKVNHYDSDSDSPAWIAEDASLPDEITRYVDGLDGSMAVETGKSGDRVLQLIDLHGDVMTTLPIQDDASEADWAALAHQTADEFGNPTGMTTGAAVVSDGASPGKDGRYGWLGGAQRSADALAGVMLMGVRLYDPATGRFWSRDPEPGGNTTTYDYCSGDPVNCTDLDGHWGFFKKLAKQVAKKVAKVAEIASNIPGPVGSMSAAISAGAYAASGNRSKALGMTLMVAGAMVGAGLAVVAAKAGGIALKVGRGLIASRKGGDFKSNPALGNKAHALFTKKVVLARGGSVGPYLKKAHGLRAGRPDGLTSRGRPMELKPNNKRAIAAGRGQLARYEKLMGAPRGSGQLWTYRQSRITKRIIFRKMS